MTIPKAGIYQVDIYPQEATVPAPDVSRLGEGLAGSWPLDGEPPASLQGDAKFVDSPFGKAVSLTGGADSVAIPRTDAMNVGEGDFTVAAWIHPEPAPQGRHRRAAASEGHAGWYPGPGRQPRHVRFETTGAGQPVQRHRVLPARVPFAPTPGSMSPWP